MDKRKVQQVKLANLKAQQDANEYQKLLHRVFFETQDGQKLLEQWKHIALVTEGHLMGKDAYDLGRMEGRKEFIRDIMNQSQQAEDR